jgi:hypothetical protein
MDDLPYLVTNTIWRYYWEEKKKEYFNDIKNKKHKLLISKRGLFPMNLTFNHPIRELIWMAQLNNN